MRYVYRAIRRATHTRLETISLSTSCSERRSCWTQCLTYRHSLQRSTLIAFKTVQYVKLPEAYMFHFFYSPPCTYIKWIICFWSALRIDGLPTYVVLIRSGWSQSPICKEADSDTERLSRSQRLLSTYCLSVCLSVLRVSPRFEQSVAAAKPPASVTSFIHDSKSISSGARTELFGVIWTPPRRTGETN